MRVRPEATDAHMMSFVATFSWLGVRASHGQVEAVADGVALGRLARDVAEVGGDARSGSTWVSVLVLAFPLAFVLALLVGAVVVAAVLSESALLCADLLLEVVDAVVELGDVSTLGLRYGQSGRRR